MARTSVEIRQEKYEQAIQEAKQADPRDPKAKQKVDDARNAYLGAVQDEQLDRKAGKK